MHAREFGSDTDHVERLVSGIVFVAAHASSPLRGMTVCPFAAIQTDPHVPRKKDA
jgi:hypothetical protein